MDRKVFGYLVLPLWPPVNSKPVFLPCAGLTCYRLWLFDSVTNIPVELVALSKWADCTIVALIEDSTSKRMAPRISAATSAAVTLGTTSSFLSGFDLMIPSF